jgi:hypothetical protein
MKTEQWRLGQTSDPKNEAQPFRLVVRCNDAH